ncbi:MAG TPA: class I SAM-dependent methyltransferase [Acidimicrobiales bacterium]|nr:class I SAM-dependent methyltransferase [Acidimicrobiales bacterium]
MTDPAASRPARRSPAVGSYPPPRLVEAPMTGRAAAAGPFAVSDRRPGPAHPPSLADRVGRAAAFALLDQIIGGEVTVFESGERHRFGRRVPDAFGREPLAAAMHVHHPGLYRRVLTSGSVGLGESYADGWWDTDDLATVLRVLDRNVRRADPAHRAVRRVTAPLADPVRRLRRQDLRRDKDDIRAHYDLGNDFFERLLDESMTYSSAIFPSAGSTLFEGSIHKIDRLCQRVGLGPDDHVLEIGTGWGGFALHAAQNYGCRVTTTTISDRQFAYARDRVRVAGLEDRVTVLDRDYRDLDGTFDAIVSIEMIEAVDWREYDTFFRSCTERLSPHGRVAMQAITIPGQRFDLARTRKDFIRRVIFPGGCLPSVEALLASSARVSDLSLVDLEEYGPHYAETLRRWRSNLRDSWSDLVSLGFDDRFGRLWDFYLAYCEAGFDERDITVVQLVLAGPGWVRRRPRTVESSGSRDRTRMSPERTAS